MNELNNKIRELFVKYGYPKITQSELELMPAIESLVTEQVRLGRLLGVEEVLLRLKQAPPVDWIDAQTWIDGEYNRLQAQLKDTTKETKDKL